MGSGDPVIGKIEGPSKEKGIYVASGHSYWGICNGKVPVSRSLTVYLADRLLPCELGPGTGRVMAEILLDGKASSADISDLSP